MHHDLLLLLHDRAKIGRVSKKKEKEKKKKKIKKKKKKTVHVDR